MFYRSGAHGPPARLRRALPAIVLAGLAFAIGAIVGSDHGPAPAEQLATRFVSAWSTGDYAHMYLDTDASLTHSISAPAFAREYEQALRTATATHVSVAGKPRGSGALVRVPVRVQTRLFGSLALDFALPITSRGGEGPRIAWARSLVFPGLAPGEALARQTALPARASLLARDGSVLAEGSPSVPGRRSSPLGEVATAVLGELGAAPAARAQQLEAEGVPPGAMVGVSGLEQAFDARLRGTPGGQLLTTSSPSSNAQRVLASAAPRPAAALRTSISPAVQRAAVLALGGQYGGIVALAPATGEILAVAGIGLDGLQPPGSTFKMVTVSGVLEADIATPRSAFPYATQATLDGVKLSNAGGEECGGTLEVAFAVSCNSVFAPLGVKLGAARLVSTAERFGFNREPAIAGAAESTIPPAGQIQGELALGSTAIGQGQVQASALQMANVAATIADGGLRPQPTFTFSNPGARPARVRALSADVARTVRRLMIAVVRGGTGTAAAIPGTVVAGKTGTAELKTECAGSSGEAAGKSSASEGCAGGAASEASNTDAWFAAFAPALHPRIDVGVLLVKDGAGGATAAPVAREVLEAGLRPGG